MVDELTLTQQSSSQSRNEQILKQYMIKNSLKDAIDECSEQTIQTRKTQKDLLDVLSQIQKELERVAGLKNQEGQALQLQQDRV